jgi:hypothetical protein
MTRIPNKYESLQEEIVCTPTRVFDNIQIGKTNRF